MGIGALLINTIIKTIGLIKWLLKETIIEIQPDIEKPVIRELSVEELMQQRYAKIRAENALKDISASKAGEQTMNKTGTAQNKKIT